MDLQNKRILFAAQYAAPYEGNFIASLKALEAALLQGFNATCAYLFPGNAAQRPWAQQFSKQHTVFFCNSSKELVSEEEMDKILAIYQPDLIYTHFEGYDLPVHNAIRRSRRTIREVWHMHDAFAFQKNPLKALYQVFLFFKHYGIPTNRLSRNTQTGGGTTPCFIAVCKHEIDFISRFQFNPYKITKAVIPNGISLSRITTKSTPRNKVFTFLAFGGRCIDKRVDILIKACLELIEQGKKIQLILTEGADTKEIAESIVGKTCPEWLKIIPQAENINSIYNQADCFVSCSVHETFSYAVAEASIFGLPVIQSDIEGTKWNERNPSTWVFKNGDRESLKTAILSVMAKPEEQLQKMCDITRQNNSKNISLDSWCEKIITFLKSIP